MSSQLGQRTWARLASGSWSHDGAEITRDIETSGVANLAVVNVCPSYSCSIERLCDSDTPPGSDQALVIGLSATADRASSGATRTDTLWNRCLKHPFDSRYGSSRSEPSQTNSVTGV